MVAASNGSPWRALNHRKLFSNLDQSTPDFAVGQVRVKVGFRRYWCSKSTPRLIFVAQIHVISVRVGRRCRILWSDFIEKRKWAPRQIRLCKSIRPTERRPKAQHMNQPTWSFCQHSCSTGPVETNSWNWRRTQKIENLDENGCYNRLQ